MVSKEPFCSASGTLYALEGTLPQNHAAMGLFANRSSRLTSADDLQIPKNVRSKLDKLAKRLGRKPSDLVIEAIERLAKVADMSRIELRDAVAAYYSPICKKTNEQLTDEQRSARGKKAASARWAASREKQ